LLARILINHTLSSPHGSLQLPSISKTLLTGACPVPAKSAATIPKSLDKAMDKQQPSNGSLNPGISIRMGPVEEMEVDEVAPATNGVNGKRKSRGSVGKIYREATSSDDEEDKPLVRSVPFFLSTIYR
jgi:hypothetical protein